MQAIQTNCPWLLRYLVTAIILTKVQCTLCTSIILTEVQRILPTVICPRKYSVYLTCGTATVPARIQHTSCVRQHRSMPSKRRLSP